TTAVRDGPYEITVMALDAWQNGASTAPVTVTVDNAAPHASLVGPAQGQDLAGTFTVRVFASDTNGVASVTLSIAGRTVDMAYNPSSGYYEYTFDTRTLADGSYSATATVTDASGKRV